MKNLFSVLIVLTFLFSCGKTNSTHIIPSRSFEKIIFHTTGCFGFCPTYHLEVDNSKRVKLFAEQVFKKEEGFPFQEDSLKMGYFKGEVNDSTFAKLNQELKTIGLDKLNFDGANCCDGSTITIIVYYQGKRKVLTSMFPPQEAQKLIEILYEICEESSLVPSEEKFVIEHVKEHYDEP